MLLQHPMILCCFVVELIQCVCDCAYCVYTVVVLCKVYKTNDWEKWKIMTILAKLFLTSRHLDEG